MNSVVDLTPAMTGALSRIGNSSATAHDLGVNGVVMKRLWEMGFIDIDFPAEGYFPPSYSLTEKGEGAAAILNAIPQPSRREQPLARIKRTVAQHYRIPAEEMVSARRGKEVARPRQVAMYLSKKLTPKSFPEIGRNFGGRDHTTVIHAVRKVESLMVEDSAFDHEVKTLLKELVSPERAVAVDKPLFPAFADALAGA